VEVRRPGLMRKAASQGPAALIDSYGVGEN
jgi:hypothetical protein